MEIIPEHDVIERLFLPWRLRLQNNYDAYKGHVYRVFNFARAIIAKSEPDLDRYGTPKEIDERIAVAACFHDVGIWLDGSMDYLAPSRVHAATWLQENNRGRWREEVELMIEFHHKLTPYRGDHAALVEPFRRGDLVDVSLGTMRQGLDAAFVREVRKQFPNAGFHRFLVVGLTRYGLRHPFNPLPMMRR